MSAALNYNSDNKRIAKNTLIVYLRLFVITVVGLVTSRLVLQALGVSDFGLYNVVGGVIALFAVVVGSLSGTTVRFLNFEIGKKNGDPNKIFNICQVTHIAFAILVLIIAETIGVFYVLNYLNVDAGKAGDAMFVFQVSTIVACIGIINVPYQSVFIAKERFFHIAVIDIFNYLVKLGLVIALLYYKGNALRFYALIMSVTTLISFVVYHFLCFKYWPSLVKWKSYTHFKEYRELLVYNNYNLLASIAMICRSQGSNILINFFFGTIVNGAYGIARTVQAFVETFMTNFDAASSPQITQNVGKGDLERASSIAGKICRMCMLLSLLVVMPLYVEMELILHLWLGIVPEYAVQFCKVMMIAIIVAATGGGFLRLKDAMGKIKWFMITYSSIYFLSLLVGYILFKMGFPPVSILVLYVISDILCRFAQLALMRIVYSYDIIPFIKEGYTKPFLIILLMIGYVLVYNLLPLQTTIDHIVGFVVSSVISLFLVFFFGLCQEERHKGIKYIKQFIKK